MDTIGLYFKLVGMSLKSQMQYRVSFVLMMAGNCIVTIFEFMAIVVLFSRFGSLQGWRLEEVAMFYGMISISYALSEAFGRGFDMFAEQVIRGEFDRTLLRPRATGFQVLSHDFQLHRAGRLLQGLAVLIWASVNIGVEWGIIEVFVMIFAVAGGIALFTGLLILQATMCFWSTQSLEVMNSFTYGGVEAIQWPLPIFKQWFAKFFIFVIPLACINYFPVLLLLDKTDPLGFPLWFHWISPLGGVIFLGVSLLVWQYGVRHYHSTGS
jgi:ABC-2 type transport system permease protein